MVALHMLDQLVLLLAGELALGAVEDGARAHHPLLHLRLVHHLLQQLPLPAQPLHPRNTNTLVVPTNTSRVAFNEIPI